MGDYCVVCGQLIPAGDVSVTMLYRRAHVRCADNRYSTNAGMPTIKLVAKKNHDHKVYIGDGVINKYETSCFRLICWRKRMVTSLC